MLVRNARKEDVGAIFALGLQNNKNLSSSDLLIRKHLSKYKVLESNLGRVIGYSKLKTNSAAAVIDEVCIKSNLRGRGLENELIRKSRAGGEFIHKAIETNKEKLKIRKEELDGVEYLVAPVVMVKEQVLNGELLPAEEIEKSAPGWNGRPVVVYHPEDKDGNEVIANDPKVIPKYEVGKVFNVEYDAKTTKLKGELWIDVSKAKRKNRDTKEALRMIQSSDQLEVSTGYIVNDRLSKKGTFDGVDYDGIQRDILPDHLALLPDEIGACSWDDGAGVRNNSNKFTSWLKRLVNNLSNKNSINTQVMNALKEEYDDFDWVNDLVHDDELNKDFAIFSTRSIWDKGKEITPSKLYAIEYEFDEDGEVVLGNTLQEVEPVQQYITKTSKEENALNKKEMLVRDVIANSKGKFGRKDKSTLLSCPDNALIAMLPKNKQKAFIVNKKSKSEGNSLVSNFFKGKKFKTNEGEEVMVEELISMTPDEVEATIEGAPDAELEAVAGALEDVIAAAEIIESLGDELETNEEFATTIEEVIEAAEEVLEVVEAELSGTDEDDLAENVDTSDIFDPEENPEEDTVSALETASKKIRANKKSRRNAKAKAGKKTMSINDYINSIPDAEAREFIKNGVAEAKAHRAKLLTALSAHKSCSFTEKELKGMETNQLEKIYGMLSGTKDRPATNSSFAVRGLQINKEKEDLGYVPLTANIFKKEDK